MTEMTDIRFLPVAFLKAEAGTCRVVILCDGHRTLDLSAHEWACAEWHSVLTDTQRDSAVAMLRDCVRSEEKRANAAEAALAALQAAIVCLAERMAAVARQNADLQAANTRVLERARAAEAERTDLTRQIDEALCLTEGPGTLRELSAACIQGAFDALRAERAEIKVAGLERLIQQIQDPQVPLRCPLCGGTGEHERSCALGGMGSEQPDTDDDEERPFA